MVVAGAGGSDFLSGLWRLLEPATASIETLVWLHPFLDYDIDLDICVGQLKSLRTVVWNVSLCRDEDQFNHLHNLLTLTVSSTVGRLAIVIEDNPYSSMFEPLLSESTTAFDIDNALHRFFGHLERLHTITIHVAMEDTEEAEGMGVDSEAGLRERFPKLDATGKLTVSLGDTKMIGQVVKSLAASGRE